MIAKAKEFLTTIPVNKVGMKELLDFEKTPRNNLIAVLTLAFIAMFVVGVAIYLGQGHHAYNVTKIGRASYRERVFRAV